MATFRQLCVQVQEKVYEHWCGKQVFFMADNRIVSGIVNGYDDYQLFVGKTHALAGDQPFFETEQELLDYLVATRLDTTKETKNEKM